MSETAVKMRETPIRSLFISYLIPSVLGMLLMAINIAVDGIFVGHALGPLGLASVNIATPVFSIFFSIALMISIGGATIYSISLGKQDLYTARLAFSNAIIFSVVLIIGIAALCYWQMERLALLFGANEKVMPYVLDYLSVILLFGFIYVLENVFSTFIRNDGNPNLAMAGLIVTSVLNIVFNYVFLFVFHWGVKGAAYATILASAIGLLTLFAHFFRKDCTLKLISLKLQPKLIGKILVTGFPSFVAEVSVAVVTLGFNIAFMRSVGETGVAAFAVVNYIHTVNMLIFVGVGAALQPISSFHFGAGLWKRLEKSLQIAVRTAWFFGLFTLAVGYFFAEPLVSIFGLQSEELVSFTVEGLKLFFLSYLFLGYNMLYAEYFQSIGRSTKSLIITLCQGMLFVFPLLWLLPYWWQVVGIWLALPIAQMLTFILLLIINHQKHPIFGYSE